MDKILRIDMGADGGPQADSGPVGDYAGLGGRALTSILVSKEVPPSCHPLGADNKLVIAPGLLSGSIGSRRQEKSGHGDPMGSVLGTVEIKPFPLQQ